MKGRLLVADDVRAAAVGLLVRAEDDAHRHGRPDAARLLRRRGDGRLAAGRGAEADRLEKLSDGGSGLAVSDAEKQAAVQRFLDG